MNAEMLFVFALFVSTIIIFLSDRFRMDMVALGVVVALGVSGILTPQEAVKGFGDNIVIMIAALFVVGEGIFRTGVASAIGNVIVKLGGKNEVRLLLVLLPVVSLLSTSISSTGTVAILIPIILNMARKARLHPARLLMPVALITLVAGTTTLIGTPPNIIVSEELSKAGRAGFGFFDFTVIGFILVAVSLVYVFTLGRLLLPKYPLDGNSGTHRSLADFTARYELDGQLHKLYIANDSPVIGRTITELSLRSGYNVTLFAIARKGRLASEFVPAMLNTLIEANDVLWLYGQEADIARLCQEQHLRAQNYMPSEMQRIQHGFGYMELLLPPDSAFIGMTPAEAAFRRHYGLNNIALRRMGKVLATQYNETRLEAGDQLLFAGAWSHIRAMSSNRDLIILQTPAEMDDVAPHEKNAPLAVFILLAMIAAMAFNWLPNVIAALLAAMLMIMAGCVSVKEAYQSLNETSLVLIAGMLPLALAMQKTGGMDFVVNAMLDFFGEMSGITLMILIFVLTNILSLFISNTATAVLVAPIGIQMAQQLGIAPEPIMLSMAIAASTAFATPIASPVTSLIVAPGRYRFSDFGRVGLPLQFLLLIMTVIIVPLFFPF